MQVFTDLIMSSDGRLGDQWRSPQEKQHVKVYLTNPDLTYADSYSISRISGQFPFLLALQANLSANFNVQAEYVAYGKPSKLTFGFAEDVLRE